VSLKQCARTRPVSAVGPVVKLKRTVLQQGARRGKPNASGDAADGGTEDGGRVAVDVGLGTESESETK
jgi:hypothetical protein